MNLLFLKTEKLKKKKYYINLDAKQQNTVI